MPNHYLKLECLKLHLFVLVLQLIFSVTPLTSVAKKSGKIQTMSLSETAYLFEPVNNTNLFLRISDL